MNIISIVLWSLWILAIAGTLIFQHISTKILYAEWDEEEKIFDKKLKEAITNGVVVDVPKMKELKDRLNYMKYRRLSNICMYSMWVFLLLANLSMLLS